MSICSYKSLIVLCFIFNICTSIDAQSWIEKRLRFEDYSQIYHDQVLVDSTKYYYDENGLITGSTTYEIKGDQKEIKHKTQFSYPSDTKRIEVIEYDKNYRIEINLTWSNGDTLAKKVIQRYTNGRLFSASRLEYNFIKEDDSETIITTSGDLGIGIPWTRTQNIEVYNSNSDIALNTSKELIGDQWVTIRELSYQYDNQRRLTLRNETLEDGRSYKDIYEYDEEGRLILNTGNNEEHGTYKQVYEYNEDGYKILDEYWLDGQLIWELIDVNLETLRFIHQGQDYYYVEELDVRKNIISETWQENIDGKITTQIFYEYDSNKNLLSEKTVRVLPDSTRSTSIENYEYNLNSVLIYKESIYDNGIIASYDKWNYDIYGNHSSIETYSHDAIVEPSGNHVEFYSILKYKDRDIPINKIPDNEGFFIFPNPATDYVNIQILDEEHANSNLTLYDLNAKSIFHTNLTSMQSTINLPYLNPGLYVLAIEKNSKIYLQKILINQ